jgi:hypothetical protein
MNAMIDADAFDAKAYVAAAAPSVGLVLAPDRIEQVAAAFALVVRMAAPALAYSMPADVEPAPVFAP